MATTDHETLTELERRAETTRGDLAHTLDALHNRITPDAIKSDVRSYARDTSQQLMQTIETQLRENPLQAMAVAVGLAYPLWRVLGRVPAPVLLIGAGLALSRRNGANGAHRGGYATGEAMGEEGGAGAVSAIKEKAADIGSQIAGKAHETMESVRDIASSTAHSASDFVSEAYEGGRNTARDAAGHVSRSYEKTRESVADTVDRHPFVVGGIAFAAGTLLAAALPVTRPENRLMGAPSDDLKRRTQDLASEGLHHAKDAARDVYQSAAAELREEGLTPEVARSTTRTAMEKVREALGQTVSGSTEDGGQQDGSFHKL